MKRLYSRITIEKAMESDGDRIIEGVASTSDLDRVGDVVEPAGVKFRLPLPFLWQHDSNLPVGTVEKATVTKSGIKFRARIAKIDTPPGLKNRVDEAWASVKAGLINAVSIGFRYLDRSTMESGGDHIREWEWLELSLVTIPANPNATITQIRAYHDERGMSAAKTRRSIALKLADAAALCEPPEKGTADMTIAELIKAIEDAIKRASAKASDIQTKASDEKRSKSAQEADDFNEALDEVESLKAELADLRRLEAAQAPAAKAVSGATETEAAASRVAQGDQPQRVASSVRFVDDRAAPGIRFAQAIKCITVGKLAGISPTELALEQYSYDARIAQIVKGVLTKAAVAGAVPTSAAWAGNIAPTIDAMKEFIGYLWPTTILGRLDGVRSFPFGYRVPRETTPAGAAWVGAGKGIPVSAQAWDNVTIGRTKVAGLLVASTENLRFATINADQAFRDDLASALQKLIDTDFVDPANAGTANIKPASITNGVSVVAPTGVDVTALRNDLQALLRPLVQANLSLSGVSIVMREDMALAISMMVNALEQPAFPGVSAGGGTLPGGVTVVASNAVQFGDLIAVHGPSIALAKDDAIEIAVSGEASIEMDSAPTNDASSGTGASTVSMFQTDSFAFRATMFANWIKTRSAAVSYIGVGAYGGAQSA